MASNTVSLFFDKGDKLEHNTVGRTAVLRLSSSDDRLADVTFLHFGPGEDWTKKADIIDGVISQLLELRGDCIKHAVAPGTFDPGQVQTIALGDQADGSFSWTGDNRPEE